MTNYLDDLTARQKRGEAVGIASICSAHPSVLKTAMRQALALDRPLLIEATCNQVNQDGGYTGMKPPDFVRYVRALADETGFPFERVHLGGDHLGPSPWQSQPADLALQKSVELVTAYAQAGFTKLHLDASMKLADDSPGPLAAETSAHRTALLARAAEKALEPARAAQVRYVVGTEVPPPGGALTHETHIEATPVERAQETIELTRRAFSALGLDQAWERVTALVVQPGVEYGDDFVVDYQPEHAAGLARWIETLPNLIYEAHSTDYQSHKSLSLLMRDHFAILKVGPGLTFAFREAVFNLAGMENELFEPGDRSQIIAVLEEQMLQNPAYWARYYSGDADELRFKRKYSFSDRMRYYWTSPAVQRALERLVANLERRPPPLSLISQFDSVFYTMLREGRAQNTPAEFIHEHILRALTAYSGS